MLLLLSEVTVLLSTHLKIVHSPSYVTIVSGLAWGAGVLAILTALLPVVLQGGEEAFEEMKDRDFNTGADVLGKNRKR